MRIPLLPAMLLALTALTPASASASLCLPQLSTVPPLLRVVGSSAGVPDSSGLYVARVLGPDGNPCPLYSTAELDLSRCTDLRLCDPGIPGQAVSCATRTISAPIDAGGYVRFLVTGAGTNHGGAPGPGLWAGRLLVGGVLMGYVTVAILDQDGAVGGPGLGVSDVAALLRDLGTGTYFGRSDLDGDGVVDVSDLSFMLEALGTGRSAEGCGATSCP